MKRLLSIALLTCMGMAAGPALAEDMVRTRSDPKKPFTGTIQEESPAGVRMKGSDKLVPAADIADVVYEVPVGIKIDYYLPAVNSEAQIETAANKRKAIAEALKHYEAVLPRLSGRQYDKVRRQVKYKVALLTFRQAQEDGTSLAPAVRLLKEFRKNFPDGWQYVPSSRLLAQLLIATGDFDGAEAVYKDLAARSDQPDEERDTFRLLAAQVSMRSGKYADAYAKLQAAADRIKDRRQKLKAQVYEAECLAGMGKPTEARAKLTAVLSQARDDRDLRALAYNTLGICCYLGKQYKEALWEFLRVDVVYHQDREEHAKALYYLCDLFDKLKEPERAEECRSKLKGKEFAGTEYQRRFLTEGAGKEK
jgi:tetratricopeptide (TPR) repeat protein